MPRPALHAVPIRDRPGPSLRTWARALVFNAVFFSSCALIHAFQLLVALPVYPLSPRTARALVAYSKEAFGVLLLGLTSDAGFGPSRLSLTTDGSVDLAHVLVRDESGQVVGFEFDRHSLWIANHQQYADWIYVWIIFVLGSISSGLCIILKASLEWTPILGPAMQFFRFAFVSKSKPLQRAGGIYTTARQALEDGTAFALLLFPEGTLVSSLTRPKSAAFAATMGVADFENTLLPRSTGLLYSLRTLKTLMPDLVLYDLTLGYPGVPNLGYAQDYYTLQSIYGRGVSPPVVHVHLRQIPLATVPLGRLPAASATLDPKQLDDELVIEERVQFQEWTYALFEDKDRLMGAFYCDGEFPVGKGQERVEVTLRLRRRDWRFVGIPLGVWAGASVLWTLWTWVR